MGLSLAGSQETPQEGRAVSFSLGGNPREEPRYLKHRFHRPWRGNDDFPDNAALLQEGGLNPLLLKKAGFLPNLRAATKYFPQKTRFLDPIGKSKI